MRALCCRGIAPHGKWVIGELFLQDLSRRSGFVQRSERQGRVGHGGRAWR